MSTKSVASAVYKFFQPGDWKRAAEPILQSNGPINPLNAGGMMGSIPRTISNMRHGNMDFMGAVKAAHKNADGKYNYSAIAGSYMGVSAAARVAGGGGIHKDRRGNSNLIGVPFV